MDPNLAPLDTITMQEQVDRMSYNQRLGVTLLAIFGGIGVAAARSVFTPSCPTPSRKARASSGYAWPLARARPIFCGSCFPVASS